MFLKTKKMLVVIFGCFIPSWEFLNLCMSYLVFQNVQQNNFINPKFVKKKTLTLEFHIKKKRNNINFTLLFIHLCECIPLKSVKLGERTKQ